MTSSFEFCKLIDAQRTVEAEREAIKREFEEYFKQLKQFLAGEISKNNQCESHRERESNEFDRQTESQLCQTDKQTDRSSEPVSEKDNKNRQTNEHTEKCDREKDRHTENVNVYK